MPNNQAGYLVLISCLISPLACAAEWSGNIALQERYFTHSPLTTNSQQHNSYLSISAEPEYYTDWDNQNQSLTFTLFARADQHDEERTHADIRELVWHRVFSNWEMKAGISKVFWGVTESQHLVDIINQTDNLENIDGEDKLGQPMLGFSMERDWGLLDFYLLPYFRQREFPGIEGRLRSYPVVDIEYTLYESSRKEHHIDYALRTLLYLDIWEVGLSYFDGTSREADFILNTSANVLMPYYRQMQQFGLDAQATTEEWLWKIEFISRHWSAQNFTAITTGFEYTIVGLHDSNIDLGIVMEYLYDDRDEQSSSFFQNDLMTGLRFNLNDTDSTEALLGLVFDLDNNETFLSLEASRRFGQNWKLNLEARSFHHIQQSSVVYPISNDSYIQLDANYYF